MKYDNIIVFIFKEVSVANLPHCPIKSKIANHITTSLETNN